MGLLEPINTRSTDPRYFLDTPQQGRTAALCPLQSRVILVLSLCLTAPSPLSLPAAAILQKVGRPNLQLQMVSGRKGVLHRRPVFSTSGKNGVRERALQGL